MERIIILDDLIQNPKQEQLTKMLSEKSLASEQEQLGNAILSTKEWFPNKTASERADMIMLQGYVEVKNGSH